MPFEQPLNLSAPARAATSQSSCDDPATDAKAQQSKSGRLRHGVHRPVVRPSARRKLRVVISMWSRLGRKLPRFVIAIRSRLRRRSLFGALGVGLRRDAPLFFVAPATVLRR